ncbi:MAG: hypothetical protein IKD77_04580 [Bacilli bacterium]|nr:hypothetical protein [Bacilli bacterium]
MVKLAENGRDEFMLDNSEKFKKLREKYSTFVYESFSIVDNSDDEIKIRFKFVIENLTTFEPEITILKSNLNIDNKLIQNCNNAIFHIGLIELISYWKATCSPNVIIKAGYINEEQIKWFKKLYFYGLGELFFTNGIRTNINDFMQITCESNSVYDDIKNENNEGYLIPIGGGKDSCVTLECLKHEGDNYCLIVNPKPVTLECAKVAGFREDRIVKVIRTIDKNLLDLNKEGYINGHTPFSSMLAFLSYFISDIIGKKYIALSNESSANESNVEGEKINHQYSKSVEFENDFREYSNKFLKRNAEYFSFLRPLNELQIAMEFSKLEKYHPIFKSCNVGSKGEVWKWCCNCPKCLFVYTILSPFLYKEKLVNIFGEDLFEKENLLETFIGLTGNGNVKPFECVGTFEEVCFAISKTIFNLENENIKNGNPERKLPYLLQYYKDNFALSNLEIDITKNYSENNNLTAIQSEILQNEIFRKES